MDDFTDSPVLYRRRIERDLAEMRDRAGLSQKEVAAELGCSSGAIGNLESGRNVPKEELFARLLRFYGCDEEDIETYLGMRRVVKESDPRWRRVDLTAEPLNYRDHVELELGAVTIEVYEARLVPGILQIPEYASTVLHAGQRSNTGVDRKVELRVRRQNVLTRAHSPAQLWVVIEEHALQRRIGSQETMRAQLDHLIAFAGRDNVQMQVIPTTVGAHVGMTNSFTILRFTSPRDPDMVSFETETRTHFYEEPAEVQQYGTIMDHLRTDALSPEESVRLIQQAREEVYSANP